MILRAFFRTLPCVALLLAAGAASAQSEPPVPFAIARLLQDFPVTLYSAPNCREPCTMARSALNKRSIPFSEILVWNEETLQKLKSVSDADQIPVLVVGREVLTGFEQAELYAVLDSAGYPPAGAYPPRSQAAPPLPEGAGASATAAKKPEPEPKLGPYDTSKLQGPPPKQGPYDPSGLKGPAPKPGPYGVPESK